MHIIDVYVCVCMYTYICVYINIYCSSTTLSNTACTVLLVEHVHGNILDQQALSLS